MATRINPQTGEVWDLVDGRWIPRSQAADSGPLSAAMVSAGARFAELGAGVQNIVAGVTGNEERQAELEAEAAERQRLMAPLEAQYPTSTFVGSMLPDLATAPLGGGSTLLGRAGVQAGLGAASGALTYRPGSALDQVLEGGLYGAAFGGGGSVVGELGGKMAARVGSRIARFARRAGADLELRMDLPEVQGAGRLEVEDAGMTVQARQQQALSNLEDAEDLLGVRRGTRPIDSENLNDAQRWAVREGDRLGWRFEDADFNPTAQRLRASAESDPLLSGLVGANREANRTRLVNQLGEALEIGPGELTPARLGQAFDQVTAKMDQVHASAGQVNLSKLKGAADEISSEGKRGLVGSEATDIANSIKAQLENSATVDPAQATVWRSQINDAFRRATSPTGRPDAFGAENLSTLQEALDDAIENATPPGQRGLYKQAREQYRLLTALRKGAALRPDGQLNVPTLSRNLERAYRREYGLGRDQGLGQATRDALRLVRVANTVEPRIGDSGTATRLALANMAQNPIQSMVLSFGARPLGQVVGMATRVDPMGAAPGLLANLDTVGGRAGGAIGRGLLAGAGM